MKTGLVLEGGAMRGMYTAGVLDVFMEQGITFDGVIGVSAGAISGCSYISGQIGRTIRYNMKYCRDRRMMSFYSFLTTGDLVGRKFCYENIPEKLDPFDYDSFRNSPIPFYVTCTNLATGRPEYLRLQDIRTQMDYMRASASMPYVSHIVETEGKKLLDGGCSDSIPVRRFMEMGYTKNVVVLTRPADYRKKPGKSRLADLCYRDYPAFAQRLKQRSQDYNRTVEDVQQLEREGKIFVIRPKTPLEIGRMSHDPEKLRRVYQRGRADALAALAPMKGWLESPAIP